MHPPKKLRMITALCKKASPIMNKKLLLPFLIVGLLFSVQSFAESYSVASTIKGITVGSTLVRVYLDTLTGNFESCTSEQKKNAYAFDPSLPGGEFMLSVVLSAKVSQQKLSFLSMGCKSDYSKITHVYFCDKAFCG